MVLNGPFNILLAEDERRVWLIGRQGIQQFDAYTKRLMINNVSDINIVPQQIT